jgi:hypothetical protein
MAFLMNRLFKLQFLGPLALFVATLSAEIAARALEYAPSSEILWFINLGMFGIFQRSYARLSEFVAIDGFQLFGIALPIFVLACIGLAAKSRLTLALSTHLSVAFAGLLLLSWQVKGPAATQASLGGIAVPSGTGFYVLASVLGACLLSFVISQLLYIRAVREEI